MKKVKKRLFYLRKRRGITKSKPRGHQPKRSQILKTTTNNREYKKWRKLVEDPQSCWFCAPHEGCNYWRSRKPKKSWKFLTKRRRQHRDI